MSKLILLIVGAAWLAVLLPPLVRARLNGSPANSVTNFRKQLNSLENAGGRYPQAQLRGMARPLAPSPRMQRQPGPLSNMTGALVRPEGARGAQAGLHLVDDEGGLVLRRQRAQRAEERGAGVTIAALALHRLDDQRGDGATRLAQEVFDEFERARLGRAVVVDVVGKREAVGGERSDGPVEGGEVELVDCLAARSRQRSQRSPVESPLE